MNYQLRNVDRLYETKYDAVTQLSTAKRQQTHVVQVREVLKRDDDKTVKALCVPMLEDPFLPMLYRAGCSIMLSLVDKDPEQKLHDALAVISDMEKILEAENASGPVVRMMRQTAKICLTT